MNVDRVAASAWRHVSYLIAGSLVEGADIAIAVEPKIASDEVTNKVPGPWRDVAPESDFGGSYLDEANITEANWQNSF